MTNIFTYITSLYCLDYLLCFFVLNFLKVHFIYEFSWNSISWIYTYHPSFYPLFVEDFNSLGVMVSFPSFHPPSFQVFKFFYFLCSHFIRCLSQTHTFQNFHFVWPAYHPIFNFPIFHLILSIVFPKLNFPKCSIFPNPCTIIYYPFLQLSTSSTYISTKIYFPNQLYFHPFLNFLNFFHPYIIQQT